MFLYDELPTDVDFQVRILEDVQGKAMSLADIRAALKELRQTTAYDLRGTPSAKALAPERIRLLARWFRAFGCHGLVVFFDEMERLNNFTAKQRMAAYEQMAWWAEQARKAGSALLPVWFATEDLDVAREKDRPAILTEVLGNPALENTRMTPRDLLAQSPRWRGWDALGKAIHLAPPSPEDLRALQSCVAELYERAYEMEHVADLEVQPQSESFRQEIRRWIAYWDMQRLYPGYTPDISVGQVEQHDEGEWDELTPEPDEA